MIEIDHVHFYVKNVIQTRNWFIQKLGFHSISQRLTDDTHTEIVGNGFIFFAISSSLNSTSPVSHYLKFHPSGVADVAFRVRDIDAFINRSDVKVLVPPQEFSLNHESLKWAKIKGWGSLSHTLIEKTTFTPSYDLFMAPQKLTDIKFYKKNFVDKSHFILGIDHVVLNVASGELEKAVHWYENIFKFQVQQTFDIKTKHSGLSSKVLRDPNHKIHFNINEPTSANSQIQEFLEANRGAGIQHIALQSINILQTVTQMRSLGLSFLSTPKTYYSQLKQHGRYGEFACITEQEWNAIETLQILVDWRKDQPESLLLQIFTKPIFDEPTFFFEFIERRSSAQGFGEGNFRALFEAIEKEQIKRNSL